MNFELAEDHRAIQNLIRNFVNDELLPLEPLVLEREANGEGEHLTAPEKVHLERVAAQLGLFGLDAPSEVGGVELPEVAMVAVSEEMGKSITPFVLPPDSPNLRMLMYAADERQRREYLEPYVQGKTISAIGISEPGAGSDPAQMKTTAVREGDDWVLNGRKIWISRADVADFTILMALTDKQKGAHGGMTAFLLDKGTPGFRVCRRIPMIGGHYTYEIELEDCRVAGWKVLGEEGHGFAAMQVRLGSRRLEMAANCIGMAQRALDMICEYAPSRVIFGAPLSSRQSIQWAIADAEMKIHAARLMTYDAAWKMDQGADVRNEISMVKAYATEMAWEIIDQAMQAHGAMGMTKELPLQMMANKVRLMRIYDGPTEVHKMVIARNKLRNYS